ncbi:EthD domain-containing protein [Mycobacterium florentinum]|nr:EthD domain-containing protein [Mycobacterium florentinum]
MDTDEFIDYYENQHVPMILSLAAPPLVYKRHYLQRGDALNIGEAGIDFDVVTEQVFTDREEFLSWIAAVTGGGNGDRVAADEARFLDRSRTRSCLVSDYVTTG